MYVRFIGRLIKSKYPGGAFFLVSTVVKGLSQSAHLICVSFVISGLTAALKFAEYVEDCPSASEGLARFVCCG